MPALSAGPARERLLVPVLLALVLLGWAALVGWEYSPYAHYVHPPAIGDLGLACSTRSATLQVAFYLTGWLLMTVAMMLPTALPLVRVFARLVQRHADAALLVTLLLLGYVAVWLAFGLVAYAVHSGVHVLAERGGWLFANAWIAGVVTLGIAGGFQFSSLKYRCLDQCRSPLAFASAHWRGGSPRDSAFRMGAAHGAYCVGCCWALMLLMFTVGLGNLGWMLLLAVLMAIEKNVAWGRRISRPLGASLLLAATILFARHALPSLGS